MAAKIKRPDIVVGAIPYNAGVEAAYRTALYDLIYLMAEDTLRTLKAPYKEAADKIGMDEDPVIALRRAFKKLAIKWVGRFEKVSTVIAERFATGSSTTFDIVFKKKLRDAGFTVRFKPTTRMIASYRAVVSEQVNLITSIPQKFLTQVESIVWVNVIKGYDLKSLGDTLIKEYGITHRRASLIARDQAAKAKAVFEEARRSELGITEAIWRHSHAGKVPRPTHVAMHGKRYNIKEGMYDSAVGKNVWPGTEINCRCSSRSVIPGD